jgi:hypothetical protein
MRLPVWVTVLISGIAGSWIGRVIAALTVLPLVIGGTGPDRLASHWVAVILVGAAGGVAATAVVLMLLLPPLSSLRVGFGAAFTAVLAGDLIEVGGTLLLLRASVRSDLAGGGGLALAPALGLASLMLWVLGIAVTAMMVNAASGGHGRDLSGYGGQGTYDQLRDR